MKRLLGGTRRRCRSIVGVFVDFCIPSPPFPSGLVGMLRSPDGIDIPVSERMPQSAIEFKAVNKWFGKLHVLRDVALEVTPGEVVVVCGPSGSGKSTLI